MSSIILRRYSEIVIKRETQIFESFSSPRSCPLFLWLWFFMVRFSQLQLLASAVAQTLKETPKLWGPPISQGHVHCFFGGISWWTLANPSSVPILTLLAKAVGEILQGNPKILVSPLAQGRTDFCYWCDFMTGLGKPKLSTKFEVTIFSHCVNSEGEPPNFGSSLSPLFIWVWFFDGSRQTQAKYHTSSRELQPLQKY